MKIRNGFVSNSSSSSFIIGIVNTGVGGEGTVFDPTKDMGWEFEVKKIDEDNYKLGIESFTYSTVECNIKPGESFLSLSSSGPDGDEYFSIYDENGAWYDIDYEKIDLDDFDGTDIDLYERIASLGGQVDYGAGRNG